MGQSVTTTLPVPSRRRRTFVAIAAVTVLALGVGVGITTLTATGESESGRRRSATATPPAGVTSASCASDIPNLLATIASMPPTVSAHVMGRLTPDLSQGLGNLVLYVEPSRLPPAPDATTLGQLLSRIDPVDRNAVMNGLSVEQQAAVDVAAQSEAAASLFGLPPACP
jgi:hypothetical protein